MAETTEFIKQSIFSPTFDLQKQYATYTGILKNAVEGKVVTRFPPEPSGYLHIGHCKAALLNYHYAKMYKGNMILRFDDTNPTKEKNQYVEAIIEDLKTLGITYAKLTYTSDYFDKIFDLLKGLIEKGLAYVDNTPVEKMREERLKKIESATRNFTVEQNLQIFAKLLAGEADEYCVRAKIDMKLDNGCMRDPVLARASKVPHHRTGTKYKVYPTYDFACPIVDSLEGVTHVLRTNEYADRIPQYMWVLGALGWPKLEIYEYSRLNLEHTCLSKRKLTWFVDTKRVEGWNDPRFPTLRGVLRKGIRVETLIEFMLEQGPSKRANLMEWEKLWAINKRIIDPICPRFSAVSVEKACRLTVTNGPANPEAVTVEQNKLNKGLGTRPLWRSNSILIEFDDAQTLLKVGERVTLMNWGNVLIQTKQLQENGSYHLTGEYLPEDKDFKTTKKITWLAEGTNLLVANLIEFDHLIKTPKVEQNQDFEQIVNSNSKFVAKAYLDSGVHLLNRDSFIQIQRRGYYRIDNIEKLEDKFEYKLILVPDGKKVGIASIKTVTDKEGDIKKKDLAEKVEDKKTKGGSKKDKKKQKQAKKEEVAVEAKQQAKKEENTVEVKEQVTKQADVKVTEQQKK